MINKKKGSYYESLGFKEKVPFTEVEKAYRQLYTEHYSKKEDITAEEKEKFQEVTKAYERITELEKKTSPWKDRGWGRKNFRGESYLQSEVLETKRVVKVTKGGRRFSFTSLSLIKDEEQKKIAFSYQGGKETVDTFRKANREGQKKLISYWSNSPRTIPRDICVKYKATKVFLKPTPPGSGIKAGSVLNKLFKYLEIKDVSTKIIGSRNKLNVVRAAFLALDKLSGKKYNY